MKDKNRFSSLLEHLMSVAELKNSVLANELQYDVSYIGKWISGRMIPSEKNGKKVLMGISHCVVTSSTEEGQKLLLSDYQVENLSDLEEAIFDNLEAEYNYVRELQKNTGSNVAPRTFYFPELTLSKYISKMRHPVLRRVKSLDIMAEMDLMAIDHEYRMQIAGVENGRNGYAVKGLMYPNVHFSMVINLDLVEWDYIYDTIFLVKMLAANLTHIDFKLYASRQAFGRAIFTVKDDFSITGMLMNSSRCMSVTVSEDLKNCNIIYNNVKSQCIREMLLFRNTTINEMLVNNDYIHSLISPNPRWLMGHMTEHFLPDDLFEELLQQIQNDSENAPNADELRKIHKLTKGVVEKSHIKLMIYESAFSNLAVSDELDFYNYKVHLTHEQRLRYIEHFFSLYRERENLEIKVVYGRFISDFQSIPDPCIFLSDLLSYLRLESNCKHNNLVIINKLEMHQIFKKFYDEIWNNCDSVVISNRAAIIEYISHVAQKIHLMSCLD